MATENGSQDIAEGPPVRLQQQSKVSTGPPAVVPKGTTNTQLLNVLEANTGVIAVAEAARNQICKNLYIHGECKFQGKGCAFRHDVVLISKT
jgi:hypothetical protein